MMIFAICVLLQILLHYNNHTVIGKSQRCFSRFHLFLPIYRVISRSIFFIRNSVKYKIYTTDGIDINCYIIIIMYKVYISCKKTFTHSILNHLLTSITLQNLSFDAMFASVAFQIKTWHSTIRTVRKCVYENNQFINVF